MDVTVVNEEYEKFTYLHALLLSCSVITYLADITLDVILVATYLADGYYWYAFIVSWLVLVPTAVVQLFSARWHLMDEVMNKATWILHLFLLGIVHRYLVVITLGLLAMKTNEEIDYRRFYQQQSDVCLLRLFDSFLESAPQLVFHLYVMMVMREEWSAQAAAWTSLSVIASVVSLGWGIAAYSSAMRMVRTEKSNMTWTGMILQTLWRFWMLSARTVALVLLAVALGEWMIPVLFCHWLLMTAWVISQKTDFCATVWEERVYNAVAGAIYCFCFFNLKEGQSRGRVAIFYTVIILENFAFVAMFWYSNHLSKTPRHDVALGAFIIVAAGTFMGMTSMLLYYRFFHPAGPCKAAQNGVLEEDGLGQIGDKSILSDTKTKSPGSPRGEHNGIFKTPPNLPPRRLPRIVQYSRSFKNSCPPAHRCTPEKDSEQSPARRQSMSEKSDKLTPEKMLTSKINEHEEDTPEHSSSTRSEQAENSEHINLRLGRNCLPVPAPNVTSECKNLTLSVQLEVPEKEEPCHSESSKEALENPDHSGERIEVSTSDCAPAEHSGRASTSAGPEKYRTPKVSVGDPPLRTWNSVISKNSNVDTQSPSAFQGSKRRRFVRNEADSRPRRKISLLRERFEPNFQSLQSVEDISMKRSSNTIKKSKSTPCFPASEEDLEKVEVPEVTNINNKGNDNKENQEPSSLLMTQLKSSEKEREQRRLASGQSKCMWSPLHLRKGHNRIMSLSPQSKIFERASASVKN